MRDLSVAQCQLIEIVKAISISAKVVVMDEPTSAITDKEVETLFRQIRRLQSEGVAIIYISHKMDEIFQICDTITVLRDGQFIGTHPAAEMDNDPWTLSGSFGYIIKSIELRKPSSHALLS